MTIAWTNRFQYIQNGWKVEGNVQIKSEYWVRIWGTDGVLNSWSSDSDTIRWLLESILLEHRKLTKEKWFR